MSSSYLCLLILASLSSAWVADPGSDQWCTYGCDQAISYNSFAGSPNTSDGYYLAGCQNKLQVSSFWACNRKYCTPTEIDAGTQWKAANCLFYAQAEVLPVSIISNLTDQDIDNLPTLIFGGLDVVNSTSLPDQTTFDLSYRTGAEYYQQEIYHQNYSNSMFIFWGVVVGLGIIHNFTRHILSAAFPARLLRYWVRLKSLLITRPFTAFQADGSRPPLLETLINTIFVIINIILCSVNFTAFDGNIFWPSTSLQTWRYLADRTGYMSYANLVIFWLFGIRNNLLIQATGWSFATFSRFHRAVAFVSTVEAIVHSIAYSFFSHVSGGNEAYLANFAEQYWNVGVVATVTMSLTIVMSVTWFRVRWYDLFLVIHIVLAIITLVMLFYHTRIFLGQYDGYLWPCVAFWALDRLLRIGRILWNIITSKTTSALIEYDQDADIVRINVTDTISHWSRDCDDAYYYIYVLASIRAWESHPFTLVRYLDADTEARGITHWQYNFIVRPYDGFTRSLAQNSLRSAIMKKCLFEGPYSSATTIRFTTNLDGIVFIIGGSGISVAISSIYRILEAEKHSGRKSTIKLIWAIRHLAFLETVLDRELRAAKGKIEIQAYLTREYTDNPVPGVDKGVDSTSSSTDVADNVSITYARPDVRQVVLDAANYSAQGKVGVITCGPVKMMNEVREGVVVANANGIERVRVFAEDFSW